MYISKIIIENFKCFEGKFCLELKNELNILVGDNEVGKSTILEAIHLALSGWIYGKHIKSEITQSLFNTEIIKKYITQLKSNEHPPTPPKVLIELYFEFEDAFDSLRARFEGAYNIQNDNACGIKFEISFNEHYRTDYNSLIESGIEILSLPIEFYDCIWYTFARDQVIPKIIPFKSYLIDSSNYKYQNGCDIEVLRNIRGFLDDSEKVNISLAHRRLVDSFIADEAIKPINEKIHKVKISEKEAKLAVEFSSKSAWEGVLTVFVDNVPFSQIGRGEQCMIKTKLGLSHKKSQEANILLIEEPENHLSHFKLNQFVKFLQESHHKQILISTHSSFVTNKLGINNVVLLNKDPSNKRNPYPINSLESENYFRKLPGYDTLRLILCKKAILVEGPSDELIVQKAYLKKYEKLPIEDEVDVISVGTGFLNFLEIADKIKKPVAVLIDNDGNTHTIEKKFELYLNNPDSSIKIFYDLDIDTGSLTIGKNKSPFNYNTLEPKLVKANSNNISMFNTIFEKDYTDIDDLHKYMKNNKTECALQLFDTAEDVKFPDYINRAIE
ncbi:MAG: ATP-dependent nuclease [Candidatus Dojkabacteria bacterium]